MRYLVLKVSPKDCARKVCFFMMRTPAKLLLAAVMAPAFILPLSCTPVSESVPSSGSSRAVGRAPVSPQFWQRACERDASHSYDTVQRLMLTGSKVRLDTGISVDGCKSFAARLVEEGETELSQNSAELIISLTSIEAIALGPQVTQLKGRLGAEWTQALGTLAQGQRFAADQERRITLVKSVREGEQQLCPESETGSKRSPTCFLTGPDADLVPFLGKPLGVQPPKP